MGELPECLGIKKGDYGIEIEDEVKKKSALKYDSRVYE